ncbi:MAG: hypothetical protein M9894_09940 [Planctomycetes bacterium]|nr:hypothetical protein [Planctomycetota bacterium]
MRLAVGLIVIACSAAGAARAAEDWRGAWWVEGAGGWRHVGREGAALVLDGRVGDLEVALRGAPTADGFDLAGLVVRVVDGEREARPARLEARAARGGALEVVLRVGDEAPRRERWARPAAPALALEPAAPRLEPDGGLHVVVRVEGRPLAGARLQVLAADDDGRYAHLGGVVHHVDLGPLAVGRHPVTWAGIDRSPDGAPVLPGRYRVVVAAADDLLGPPPGEERPALAAEVTLDVGGPDLAHAGPRPAPRGGRGRPEPAARIEPAPRIAPAARVEPAPTPGLAARAAR